MTDDIDRVDDLIKIVCEKGHADSLQGIQALHALGGICLYTHAVKKRECVIQFLVTIVHDDRFSRNTRVIAREYLRIAEKESPMNSSSAFEAANTSVQTFFSR